ncbi:MAG: MFS transporter [Pseudomonadota bacterium]
MSEFTKDDRQSLNDAIRAFAEPKMAMMLVLGFTAGLPFLLYFSTLSYWLRSEGVDVAIIGFFSFFGLSWSFKFLWAPILDRYDVPGLSRMFGRRRAWILVAQLGVATGMAGIGFADPTKNLEITALFSLLLAFSSASQDIGIDGWRIEAAKNDDEQTILVAAYQYGYRVGLITAGGLALVIADFTNFNIAYLSMAAIMVLGAIVFSVWDRPSGLKTAAAAGVTLMIAGIYGAFSQLQSYVEDGTPGEQIASYGGQIWLAATIACGLGFLYLLSRALRETSPGQTFSLTDLTRGLASAGAIISLVTVTAIGIGLAIPAVLDLFGISVTRSDIGQTAIYFAAVPLLIAACFIAPVRKLPANSSHLKHPAYGAFADFFWRHGYIALLILCFVSFYRLSDIVMGLMAKPAYADMGYGPAAVGLVSGFYGVWITFIGVAAAGLSALRLGLKVSLIIGATVSVIGNLTFAWLVNQSSDSLTPLFIAITADNIAGGYAGTVFIAYMSSFVNKSFAGTQYAIFSSAWSLGPKLVGGASGYLVSVMGYTNFFVMAGALGVPAIVLSFFVDRMKADRDVLPEKLPAAGAVPEANPS